MKKYREVVVQLHAVLTSALDGDEWSASRPDRFTPGETVPIFHWIGDTVDPRTSVDVVVSGIYVSVRNKPPNILAFTKTLGFV
jgi:hypothetical protein